MSQSNVGTQVVIGPYEAKYFTPDEAVEHLEKFHKKVGLNSLMIWNTKGPAWFDAFISFCEKHNIEAYLWFPVLADRLSGPPENGDLVRSYNNYAGNGKYGRWDMIEDIDEDFLFICPSRSEQISLQEEQLDTLLSKYNFSGVFLDRIRFPSPANGLEMLFSCFCNNCKEIHSDADLISADSALSELVDSVQRKERHSWEDFLSMAGLKALAKKRENQIDELVSTLSKQIRSHDKKVGLDLFSPCLAPLVGQNYKILSAHCDWIKVMSYCHVIGPAGLSLEIDSLITGLINYSGDSLGKKDTADYVESLLELPCGTLHHGFEKKQLPEEIVRSEMEKALRMSNGVSVVPGIELVDHPQFKTSISPLQTKRYLDVLHDFDNRFIACWNALYIPETNYSLITTYNRGE